MGMSTALRIAVYVVVGLVVLFAASFGLWLLLFTRA
jgi:hypothetical protein